MQKLRKGRFGERLAAGYLVGKGYKIRDLNWYCRWGEIDIVATENRTLVFVEVKYRTSRIFGQANQAVNYLKLKSLKRTIWRYMKVYNLFHATCRLDVICIEKYGKKRFRLHHYKSITF